MPFTADCLPNSMVNIRERSGSCTPGVQGITGPSSLVYIVHTDSIIELFRSDFGEPYKFVQQLYKNAFHCRLFAITW